MKTPRTIALACLMLAALSVSAPAQFPRASSVAELFLQLDSNRDNVLDSREVPRDAVPAFEQLVQDFDANGDKRIDGEEYREMLLFLGVDPGASKSKSRPKPDPAAGFKQMDKDGDGRISRREFVGPELMFERLDANKSGYITEDEVERAGAADGPNVSRGDRFKALDRNKDGKLDRDEYPGSGLTFLRLDANRDGYVTPYELMTPREREAAARLEELEEKAAEAKKAKEAAKSRDSSEKESRSKTGDGKKEEQTKESKGGKDKPREPQDGSSKEKAKGAGENASKSPGSDRTPERSDDDSSGKQKDPR